jgi:hypothetical protein
MFTVLAVGQESSFRIRERGEFADIFLLSSTLISENPGLVESFYESRPYL